MISYARLQNKYDEVNDGSVAGEYYLTVIVPRQRRGVTGFLININTALGTSHMKWSASQATLNLANAIYRSTRPNRKTLEKNNGI
jgi:hypothetical protein